MPSDFITRKLAQTIFHAFDFAAYVGRPLNTYAVVILDADPKATDRIMQRIKNKCRRWLKRKQQKAGEQENPPLHVYTFECPDGAQVHVNWVLHLPAAFQDEFRQKMPDWVRKSQGRTPRDHDIIVQGVDPGTDKSLAKYILKGTDPAYVPHFFLEDYAEPQGPIYGRRAGASMALNKAARNAAGFVPKRHIGRWKEKRISRA
jgi:hypothetical protein